MHLISIQLLTLTGSYNYAMNLMGRKDRMFATADENGGLPAFRLPEARQPKARVRRTQSSVRAAFAARDGLNF